MIKYKVNTKALNYTLFYETTQTGDHISIPPPPPCYPRYPFRSRHFAALIRLRTTLFLQTEVHPRSSRDK